jgi:hypothetical protein
LVAIFLVGHSRIRNIYEIRTRCFKIQSGEGPNHAVAILVLILGRFPPPAVVRINAFQSSAQRSSLARILHIENGPKSIRAGEKIRRTFFG